MISQLLVQERIANTMKNSMFLITDLRIMSYGTVPRQIYKLYWQKFTSNEIGFEIIFLLQTWQF